MELSNYKVVIGFSDDPGKCAIEYKEDYIPSTSTGSRYLLRVGKGEKFRAEWQLFNTPFVKKWLTQWENTIDSRHCVLITSEETYVDLNFVDIFNEVSPVYITEEDMSSVVKHPGECDLTCQWYKAYNDDRQTQHAGHPYYHHTDFLPYTNLAIGPSMNVDVCISDVRGELSDKSIDKYPQWFRAGTLVLGQLIGDPAKFKHQYSKFSKPVRVAIVKV